ELAPDDASPLEAAVPPELSAPVEAPDEPLSSPSVVVAASLSAVEEPASVVSSPTRGRSRLESSNGTSGRTSGACPPICSPCSRQTPESGSAPACAPSVTQVPGSSAPRSVTQARPPRHSSAQKQCSPSPRRHAPPEASNIASVAADQDRERGCAVMDRSLCTPP